MDYDRIISEHLAYIRSKPATPAGRMIADRIYSNKSIKARVYPLVQALYALQSVDGSSFSFKLDYSVDVVKIVTNIPLDHPKSDHQFVTITASDGTLDMDWDEKYKGGLFRQSNQDDAVILELFFKFVLENASSRGLVI